MRLLSVTHHEDRLSIRVAGGSETVNFRVLGVENNVENSLLKGVRTLKSGSTGVYPRFEGCLRVR